MEITTEQLSPAFTKHHVEGLGFDCSFNVFTEPDTGYPHDHPFDFVTHIISGGVHRGSLYRGLFSKAI